MVGHSPVDRRRDVLSFKLGKLAQRFRNKGRWVLLCAAGAFRAAAIEQLEIWAERTGSPLIRQNAGSRPSAELFDAVNAGRAQTKENPPVCNRPRRPSHASTRGELKIRRRLQTLTVQIGFFEQPACTAKPRRFSQAAMEDAWKAPPAGPQFGPHPRYVPSTRKAAKTWGPTKLSQSAQQ